MPRTTVKRAEEVLAQLEGQGAVAGDKLPGKGKGKDKEGSPRAGKAPTEVIKPTAEEAVSLFQLDDPLLADIRDALLGIDIDRLTPLQALTKLHDLQSLLTGRQ